MMIKNYKNWQLKRVNYWKIVKFPIIIIFNRPTRSAVIRAASRCKSYSGVLKTYNFWRLRHFSSVTNWRRDMIQGSFEGLNIALKGVGRYFEISKEWNNMFW